MNGGRESRRPRPALGCIAIDDDDDEVTLLLMNYNCRLVSLTLIGLLWKDGSIQFCNTVTGLNRPNTGKEDDALLIHCYSY
jgi:hypothetical protein